MAAAADGNRGLVSQTAEEDPRPQDYQMALGVLEITLFWCGVSTAGWFAYALSLRAWQFSFPLGMKATPLQHGRNEEYCGNATRPGIRRSAQHLEE